MSIDLFEHAGIHYIPTETKHRLVQACTMLKNAHPNALEVVWHLDWWRKRKIRPIGAGGGYAYTVNHTGIHYEDETVWWQGEPIPEDIRERYSTSWDPRSTWTRPPKHHVTWEELRAALHDHPLRAGVVAWASRGWPWSILKRPNELFAPEDQWSEEYTAHDRAHPAWSGRLKAWEDTLQILTDTITTHKKE